MGVTIHFEGQLFDERAFGSLVLAATTLAKERGWTTEHLECADCTLLRVRDEKDWDYRGPTKGVVIYPHIECEPVRLEFDRDLYLQEYSKTQFAGVTTHVQVLELLSSIKPFFRSFRVEDEGEYWETGNIEILAEHMNRIQEVIEEELRKNPEVRAKVKTPSGRIMDLMS